jgi:hypothetical protein
MIDEYQVGTTPFEESHLLSKLKKAVTVARIVGRSHNDPTYVHFVTTIELRGNIYEIVRADYELVQQCLNDPKRGFLCLSGKMGTFVQPRTKGRGHGSTSRAFYARKDFLSHFINLNK